MNLYIRLFFMFLLSHLKGRISVMEDFKTRHFVWPNDIDLLGHMNNGRYFTIMDIVRIEMMIRGGIWKEMKKRNIYGVVAGETVQFRKPLRLFQKYSIITRTLGWDDKYFYIEHKFLCKNQICALMIIKIRIIGTNSKRIAPKDILQFVSIYDIDEENMDKVINSWNQSSELHWQDSD